MKINTQIILIIGFLGYTIVFWLYALYQNEPWIKYVGTLYNLGVVIALIGFILERNDAQEHELLSDISRITRDQEVGFIDVEKEFMNYYPELLPLYKEMNQRSQVIQSVPIPQNIDVAKKIILEYNACNIFIQRLENTYLATIDVGRDHSMKEVFTSEFNEWVLTWRNWFKSPTLRRIWKENSVLFSSRTKLFIDNVIIGKLSMKQFLLKYPNP
jgi:hypothetical protein